MTTVTVRETEQGPTIEQNSSLKRYVEAVSFVAVWMAFGVGLRLSGLESVVAMNAYLLIGIPLMVLFQCCVRKERLVTLWIRDAQRFNIGVVGLLMAMALAVAPAYQLWGITPQTPLQQIVIAALWCSASIVGAFGAGFCICNVRPGQLRKGLPGFVAAAAFGIGIVAMAALASGKPVLPVGKASLFAQQFLPYFTVCFALEEVVFRGMLDPHLQLQPATGWSAWLSAIAVSILWGLWHLPLIPISDLLSAMVLVPSVCLVHVLFGVPLSFCSRSSGSLLLSSFAHALADAFRNAVLM